MAKTIFPPISQQQTRQDRPMLLAVQSTPLSLVDTGTVLFGSQIALSSGRGILQLSFQASFTFPLRFSMECRGLGTYLWALSGDPNSAQLGQTAFCTHTILITRSADTGAPIADGVFISLIPSLGLQSALTTLLDEPVAPVLLEGNSWILRLLAPSGMVNSASLVKLYAESLPGL